MRTLGRRGLRASLSLVALGSAALLASSAATAATFTPSARTSNACARTGLATTHGHIGGLVSAVNVRTGCAALSGRALGAGGLAGGTANGNPPLIWHGGAVMGTSLTGPLVITPIYWEPADHPMASSYTGLISTYLKSVALASGSSSNVYAITTEYSGTDGKVKYRIKLGAPIIDTNALPASGCTVDSADTANIYADGSGYDACLDDAQVVAETNAVVAAHGLPDNLSHMYVIFLPKHVESCFNPGSTTSTAGGQACTINYQPTAAYCAYHSEAASHAVYANMPFPIYLSATQFTCGTDVNYPGVIETPNKNPDADTEISPTSHEIIEATTDPDTSSGWYDISGYEIGDECAYIFGKTSGTPGHFYNQTIDKHHFFTQEEFSNKSFFASGGGCLQGE